MKQKIAFMLAVCAMIGTIAGCSANAQSSQTAYIGEEAAYTAALSAVGLGADKIATTETQLSEQDGIAYYEVDFTADGTDYHYAIDAVTGVVIESQADAQTVSGFHTPAPGDITDTVTDFDTTQAQDADTNGKSAGDASAAKAPETSKASAEITLEQAKQIALTHAGKTNVTFVKEKKEFEDGQWIYEVEFITQSGNSYQEYDYEIAVSTGKILSYDQDAEDYVPPKQASADKTEDEVRSIALAKVPGAKASDCTLALDEEDGRLVYEGKILYQNMEYEFEIDAHSGTILDWEADSIYD